MSLAAVEAGVEAWHAVVRSLKCSLKKQCLFLDMSTDLELAPTAEELLLCVGGVFVSGNGAEGAAN